MLWRIQPRMSRAFFLPTAPTAGSALTRKLCPKTLGISLPDPVAHARSGWQPTRVVGAAHLYGDKTAVEIPRESSTAGED